MNLGATSEVLDQNALLDRVGGDFEFLQEIVGLFLEDCPKLLSAARTAISGRDASALEHAAHSLKGSVANFGAEAARQAALRLEKIGRAGELHGAEAAYADLEREIQRFEQALAALSNACGHN